AITNTQFGELQSAVRRLGTDRILSDFLAASDSQVWVKGEWLDDATGLVTFDGDTFIDYRARRPVMELREGVSTRLVWADLELRRGTSPNGVDVLLLTGPEPDMQWRSFARHITMLATRLGVYQMVGLGAYPFATPHTRSPRLSGTSPSSDVIESVPYLRSSLDAPAGAAAVLEHALTEAGIASLGLWAQVPHYVSAMAYPAASVALLHALHDVTGIAVEMTSLESEAIAQQRRIDRLIEGNDEHVSMLRQLEAAYDSSVTESDSFSAQGPLPTGDDIAAEFERFLRDQAD
ncbi:MAG: proteasome assembly chaperone family protein, partial [Ilumatobacteraceae bacterium]